VLPHVVSALALKDSYQGGSHNLASFAFHVAGKFGSAALSHVTFVAVTSLALGARTRRSPLQALHATLVAIPVLLPAWIAVDFDTLLRLWNDWTQAVREPTDALGRMTFVFGLIGADFAVSVAGVATLGVFTPVVLSEHLGIVPAAARAWRLLRGGRLKMVGLFCAESFAGILLLIPTAGLVGWLRLGSGAWTTGVEQLAIQIIESSWAVIAAASYLELRRRHDGALPETIAETFS
jgi:hypothetical protein